jgi:HEAT repeat protein
MAQGASHELVTALEDPSEKVRWSAILALAQTAIINDEAFAEVAKLVDDPSPLVARYAVLQLSAWAHRGEGIADVLLPVIQGPDPLRSLATRTLAAFGEQGPRIVESLLRRFEADREWKSTAPVSRRRHSCDAVDAASE